MSKPQNPMSDLPQLEWRCPRCKATGSVKLHPPTFQEFMTTWVREGYGVSCNRTRCRTEVPATEICIKTPNPQETP